MSIYLGIDFGTSTNVVTRWDTERKQAQPVPLGKYGSPDIFPNVIFYQSPTNKIVGDDAESKGKEHPENAVFSIKRRLESSDFRQPIPALGRSLSSEEVAADIFGWIKEMVEAKYGGESIDGVVISVPFAFQNRERKRIERAAGAAGLNVLGLIEEPVAAALSFGLMDQTERGKAEKILVFDLGGGTFDVTIFDFRKQSDRQFAIRVITTDGAKELGGIDIDNLMVDKILAKMSSQYPDYRLETRDSVTQEKETFKIRQLAEETKKLLSDEEEADLFTESTLGDEFLLDEILTQEDFAEWLKVFLVKIENVLDDALLDADLESKDIDRIIMVGGTSNIPAIKDKVREYFGQEPQEVGNLTLMVGEGAGIYCGLKYVDKSLDCRIEVGVSHNIALKWGGKFILMLERNTIYGTPSVMANLKIPNVGKKDISIPIVQGSKHRNNKIGSIPVTTAVQKRLTEDVLGVKLNTDQNNGTISYELYNGSTLLASGKAEED